MSLWIALLALLEGWWPVAGYALIAALFAALGWLLFGPGGRWL